MTDVSYSEPTKVGEATFGDYLALLKPRVMSLVVFTAFVGMMSAPTAVHPMVAIATILFIAVGAGAAGALNMWSDANIDQNMRRTRHRPVPAGRIAPNEALALGLALAGISITMLWLAANALAAMLLTFTIFFYAVIYSLWLKHVTPQNIVIGGAAGALPPVIGWAAASGTMAIEAWQMFALIFLWTPPHFWALALFMRSDYDDARIPMLTVTHGRKATRAHILAYTILLAVLAIAMAFTAVGGPLYFAVAIVYNSLFLHGAIRIWRRDEAVAAADKFIVEKRFFRLSLYYLLFHFAAILAETSRRSLDLGGWL